VAGRFEALGWHTLDVNGHDRIAVDAAVTAAVADARPSLIVCHTKIAYGAPTLEGTAKSHGSPLGEQEIAGFKQHIGWELPPFTVPDEAYAYFKQAMEKGKAARAAWEQRRTGAHPDTKDRWDSFFAAKQPAINPPAHPVGAMVETRKASGAIINLIAAEFPPLIGGSADLEPSTNTLITGTPDFQDDPAGRNIRFGVREHIMGAVVNGIAVHGGLRPFGATFLIFSDYMRPALRLGALMKAPSIFVFTHDSILLGEDGPTHQPIEHLASLRAMPNMWVVRPADAGETAEAWELALKRTDGPTCLILTRQGVPVLDRNHVSGQLHRGGYVLRPGTDAVLVATGSEVAVALAAADRIAEEGISLRVVSLPCWEAFFAQDVGYRSTVLGDGLPTASLEAATTFGWDRIVGRGGLSIGIDHFGASAPAEDLAAEFGFTAESVAARVLTWLRER